MVVENVWRIRGVREKFWCARFAVTKVAFFTRLGQLGGVWGGLAPPTLLQTVGVYRGGGQLTFGTRAVAGNFLVTNERPLRMLVFI